MTLGPNDGSGRSDYLYVVDGPNSTVLRFDADTGSGGEVFISAGSGGMNGAYSGWFGPDGNYYVVEQSTDKVLRFDGYSGAPLGAAGNPADATFVNVGAGGLDAPQYLTFDASGDLYVSSAATDEIIKYQGPNGANPGQTIGTFVTASHGLRNPTFLEFGPDGYLYVADVFLNAVLRFDGETGLPLPAQGISGAFFVDSGDHGLGGPWTFRFRDIDGTGTDLFVASHSSTVAEVLRFDGLTGNFVETTVSIPQQLATFEPEFLPDGTLLVSFDWHDNGIRHGDIRRFVPASRAVFTVSLSAPTSHAVSVDVNTVSGTAGTADYSALSLSIVFAPGETVKTIVVSTTDDAIEESIENFTVELSIIGGGANPGKTVGTGTIIDNDQPNQPPLAQADAYSAGQDQDLIATVAQGVLANDSDPDGDTLSGTVATAPSNGQLLAFNADGSFTYRPNAGFFGQDAFTYEVSDGHGGTATATVTITVNESTLSSIWVGAITLEQGQGGRYRAVFEVHDGSNQPLAGVQIQVSFAGITYSGLTDSQGLFKTKWVKLSSGASYDADVLDLVLSGHAWDDFADDDEVLLTVS